MASARGKGQDVYLGRVAWFLPRENGMISTQGKGHYIYPGKRAWCLPREKGMMSTRGKDMISVSWKRAWCLSGEKGYDVCQRKKGMLVPHVIPITLITIKDYSLKTYILLLTQCTVYLTCVPFYPDIHQSTFPLTNISTFDSTFHINKECRKASRK